MLKVVVDMRARCCYMPRAPARQQAGRQAAARAHGTEDPQAQAGALPFAAARQSRENGERRKGRRNHSCLLIDKGGVLRRLMRIQ